MVSMRLLSLYTILRSHLIRELLYQEVFSLHFPPLADLAGVVQNLLSKFQDRCVVPSPVQPLQRCLSLTAGVASVHQI